MKNRSRLLMGIIISVMVLIVSLSLIKKYGNLFFDSADVADSAPKNDFSFESVQNSEEISISDSSLSLIEKVTFGLGDTCVTENWEYTITDVFVTKSCNGMTPYINDYFPCNENGDFICDYSYIIADMNLKNDIDEERELHMNSSRIELLNNDENGMPDMSSTIATAYTYNSITSPVEREFFKTTFEPYENKQFRIGYKIEDSYLSQNFDIIRILINHSGMEGFNKNIRYYKIAENESLKEFFNETND